MDVQVCLVPALGRTLPVSSTDKLKCMTVYETLYRTLYEEKCSTSYKTECVTSYDEICDTRYETSYEEKVLNFIHPSYHSHNIVPIPVYD